MKAAFTFPKKPGWVVLDAAGTDAAPLVTWLGSKPVRIIAVPVGLGTAGAAMGAPVRINDSTP